MTPIRRHRDCAVFSAVICRGPVGRLFSGKEVATGFAPRGAVVSVILQTRMLSRHGSSAHLGRHAGGRGRIKSATSLQHMFPQGRACGHHKQRLTPGHTGATHMGLFVGLLHLGPLIGRAITALPLDSNHRSVSAREKDRSPGLGVIDRREDRKKNGRLVIDMIWPQH